MKKIGFLILGILVVDVYFIYRHVSTIQDNQLQKLNVDSALVNDLYSKVNPSEDATVLKGFYREEKIQNQYIIAVGIANYLKENQLQSPAFISSRDVERMVHRVFGYDVTFTHEDALLLSAGVCGYQYDEDLKRYETMGECEGNTQEKFYRKIISAEQTGDWILLTEKSIYFYDDWNDKYSKKFVYNGFDREEVLDYFETLSYEQIPISIDNYLNDATTYVYYFRLKNGEYIFKGMEKLE